MYGTSFKCELDDKPDVLHYSLAMKKENPHANCRHTICMLKDIIALLTKDTLKHHTQPKKHYIKYYNYVTGLKGKSHT